MELDVDQFVEEFLVKSRSAPKQVESYLLPHISTDINTMADFISTASLLIDVHS